VILLKASPLEFRQFTKLIFINLFPPATPSGRGYAPFNPSQPLRISFFMVLIAHYVAHLPLRISFFIKPAAFSGLIFETGGSKIGTVLGQILTQLWVNFWDTL
jgi:hypothetical protein